MTRKELENIYFELGKKDLKKKFGNRIGGFRLNVNDDLKVFITTAYDENGILLNFANPYFFEDLKHTRG